MTAVENNINIENTIFEKEFYDTYAPGYHVITKISFESDDEKHLSFEKSETLKIISVHKEQNYLFCRNMLLVVGLVETGSVEPMLSFFLYKIPFFHGKMSYKASSKMLKNCQSGSYILRASNDDRNRLSLEFSCNCEQKYHRTHMLYIDGCFVLSKIVFKTLDEVLERISYQKKQCNNLKLANPIIPQPEDWELSIYNLICELGYNIPITDIIIGEKRVGSGEFGQVFKGIYLRQEVAVKNVTNKENYNSMLQEMMIMIDIYHPNIVQFYAAITSEGKINAFAIEWCENKDLLYHLKNKAIDLEKIIYMIHNLSDAFAYLSSLNIVHGDIAARNILLDKNFSPKISDFGLASVGPCELKITKLPHRWMAPEAIQTQKITIESDIWSFGVLMWEAYSWGESPYKFIPIENLLDSIIELNLRLNIPSECPEKIYGVMKGCWLLAPEKRFSFKMINYKIAKILKKR